MDSRRPWKGPREGSPAVHPLHDGLVRKVRVLKEPEFELGELMELHGEGPSSGQAAGEQTVLRLSDLTHLSPRSS